MTHRVLVTPRTFGESGLAVLAQAGCEVIRNPYARVMTGDEMTALIAEVDGVVVGLDPMGAGVLAHARQLKAISKYGVGLDNIDIEAAAHRGIPVTYTPGTNSSAVAELAFGLMLDTARSISTSDRRIRQGEWGRFSGTELWGKTLGIVGTGQIGKQLALRSRGFEMQLICYDVVPDLEWASRAGAEYVPLHELLARADFVSLHVPLVEGTFHLVSSAELGIMKPTAVLVNTSRGGIVDEKALFEALSEKRLAGAGLDVVESEPPQETPLARLDNVVLTSHIGAHTREASVAMSRLAAVNLVQVLRGEQPEYVANREMLRRIG